MKNTILLLFLLLLRGYCTVAQNEGVSIKSTAGAPDPSAMLDVVHTSKGVLIPRVSLSSLTSTTSPVNNPATSLLVYNTNTTVTGGAGFYYFNGTAWTKIGSELWTKIGSTNDIQYNNSTTHKVIVGNSVSTPTYNLEVLATTTDTYACRFDAAKGQQMRFGYNDLNGVAGAGPGSFLTLKSGTNTSTSSESVRFAHVMSNDELAFTITSYGKPYSTVGQVNIESYNNNMFLGAGGSLSVYSASTGVAATLSGSSNWVGNSDSTLKTNIVNQESVLSKIALCRPVKYRFKTQSVGTVNHGFLAQELETVFPELVSNISIPVVTSGSGVGPRVSSYTTKKGVDYTALIPILLKAIQEQQVIIDDLKTRLHALDNK